MNKRKTTPYDLNRAGKGYKSNTPYEKYLKKLRKRAAWIKDIDADEYLNEIRGRNE